MKAKGTPRAETDRAKYPDPLCIVGFGDRGGLFVEKLAWWRKTRDCPVTMMEGDGISIVRMPSRPRGAIQVLAEVPDFAAARKWLDAHGYTE